MPVRQLSGLLTRRQLFYDVGFTSVKKQQKLISGVKGFSFVILLLFFFQDLGGPQSVNYFFAVVKKFVARAPLLLVFN